MKTLFLPLLFIISLSGCSIIALPFKAVGAIGDIISKSEKKKDNDDIETTVVMSMASSGYSVPEQHVL